MTDRLTIECDIHFDRKGRGSRKVLANGPRPHRPTEPSRVPRVARLMALVLRFEQLLREGAFENLPNYPHSATSAAPTSARS